MKTALIIIILALVIVIVSKLVYNKLSKDLDKVFEGVKDDDEPILKDIQPTKPPIIPPKK